MKKFHISKKGYTFLRKGLQQKNRNSAPLASLVPLRSATRAITTNHSRTRLITITNHVIVHTHKKFHVLEMVCESCITKVILLKLDG